MKILPLLVAFFLGALSLYGCQFFLKKADFPDYMLGTWKSDREKTIHYNQNNVKMHSGNLQHIQQLFGHMELNITKDRTYSYAPSYGFIELDGNVIMTKEFREEKPYEVLYHENGTVVTRTENDSVGPRIYIQHFNADRNEYWIYLGYNGLFDLHLREYFTKLFPKKP